MPQTACFRPCTCVLLFCSVQFTDTALVRGMQQANAEQAADVMKDTQGRLLTVDKVGSQCCCRGRGWLLPSPLLGPI